MLAKDMIEPKRKFTDMTKVWAKLRSKRSGGPGGLLQLTVVQARELRCAFACTWRSHVAKAAFSLPCRKVPRLVSKQN